MANAKPERDFEEKVVWGASTAIPIAPFRTVCEACHRQAIERQGGWWCRWCRRWLNDPRSARFLL